MGRPYLLALITTRRWRHELENYPDLHAQLPHQPDKRADLHRPKYRHHLGLQHRHQLLVGAALSTEFAVASPCDVLSGRLCCTI
jgi:hypothetical protein